MSITLSISNNTIGRGDALVPIKQLITLILSGTRASPLLVSISAEDVARIDLGFYVL